MKLLVPACVITTLSLAMIANAAIVPIAISPISAADLEGLDEADIAYLEQQYARTKRSGHGPGNYFGGLKSGIKEKLGMIGKASGHFGSSASHYYQSEPDYKSFDIWSFKKSVLYTLLQAVKAIKGGVIAIKGQLIKGGGQLLATKGKIIKGGGEALSNLGKSIATSAFMIVPQEDHHEEHYEYAAPTGYGHSGPDVHHHSSAPSGPGPEYGQHPAYSNKFNSVYEGKHEKPEGIVILKKMPGKHGHGEHRGHGGHSGHGGHGGHGEHSEHSEHGGHGGPSGHGGHGSHEEHSEHHELSSHGNEHGEESKPVAFKPMKQETADYHDGVKGLLSSVFSSFSHSKHKDGAKKEEPHDIPATSYGVPVGPSVKYQNQQQPQMYVTPAPLAEFKLEVQKTPHKEQKYKINVPIDTPITYKLELPLQQQQLLLQQQSAQPHQQSADGEKPQIFIGMNLPINDLQSNYPDYLVDVLGGFPYSQQQPQQQQQQGPSKFFINYPDSVEVVSRDSLPQSSKRVPKPPAPRKTRNVRSRRRPNFDMVPLRFLRTRLD